MSGEADGLILAPLALAAMPWVLGGLAIAGVAVAAVRAGKAAAQYESERRSRYARREAIRQSGAAGGIGDFRRAMSDSMNEQTRLNAEASKKMTLELESQRNAMLRAAERNDPQAYLEYTANLKTAHAQTIRSISDAQNDFNQSYRQKIAESMSLVSEKINSQYSAYMSELRQLETDISAKNKKAQEIASVYIEEAKTLLSALTNDFEGKKFSARQVLTLGEQLNQAVSQYNGGRFEGAAAGAKDAAVNILEEIYEADALRQERDNYFKLALVLSEEVKAYIESQGTVTAEAKEYAEKISGKHLEDEIVGIKISDYTGKNKEGQTRYDFLSRKADEVHSALRQPDAEQLTTEQLKTQIDFLNNDLYPDAAACVSRGVVNMNNAFSRQNISEELIDFFEEHNFMFNGYAYEDGRHDGALHFGLENGATGEELIITLAPELLNGGDVQTRVDIKQIKGDEANEERKAYYRRCVEDVIKGSNPYARVDIKCKAETKNRLSFDTETKKKLRMQQ